MELKPGDSAPAVKLDTEGRAVRIAEPGRAQVLFFFKVDCPTSPLAVPAFEAMRRSYGAAKAAPSFVPISQDEPAATREWADEHGLATAFVCDGERYPASAGFGLVSIPTAVIVDASGKIAAVQEGWSRDGYEALSRRVAELCGAAYQRVTTEGGPAFRPG